MAGSRKVEKDSADMQGTPSTNSRRLDKDSADMQSTPKTPFRSLADNILMSGADTPTSVPSSPAAAPAAMSVTPTASPTTVDMVSSTSSVTRRLDKLASIASPSPSPTALPPSPITTPGGSRATIANTKEVFTDNIKTMEKLGYQQFTHTLLPDIVSLNKILKNPADAKGTLAQLVTNLQHQAATQKAEKPKTFFETKIQNIINVTNKITTLIKENKLKPLDEAKVILGTNKMSRRLFLNPADGKLYLANYRPLFAEKLTAKNAENVVKLQVSQFDPSVFAILLTKTTNNEYALEHRVFKDLGAVVRGSGHDELIDGQTESLLLAGEACHTNGQASIIANKTSHHVRMTELEISADDQEAILNLCLHGLLGRSYRMELTNGIADTDKYDQAVRDAINASTSAPTKSFRL